MIKTEFLLSLKELYNIPTGKITIEFFDDKETTIEISDEWKSKIIDSIEKEIQKICKSGGNLNYVKMM